MVRNSVFEKFGYLFGGAGVGIIAYSLFQRNQNQISKPVGSPNVSPPKNNHTPGTFTNSDLLKYGFSGPISDIRLRQGYVASYNRMLRNPNYVLELITKESLKNKEKSSRENSKFMEDQGIPEQFRAKLSDYKRSGYDRGHMVPAADVKFSQAAMDETFYLTNMSPQVGQGFNRDYWAWFEGYCRKLTNNFSKVYVLTGPLYLPTRGPQFPDPQKWYVQYEVIGDTPNVAVPTHFFKVILAVPENESLKPSIGAFILPNRAIPENIPLKQFQVPVATVEKAAGAIFFDRLGQNKDKDLLNLCNTTDCQLVIRKFNEQGKLLTN